MHRSRLVSIRTLSGISILFLILACSTLSAPVKTATATPASSPTKQPTVIPSPTPEKLFNDVFSLDNANSVPPEDVLAEVRYDGAGGGSGYLGDCYDTGPEYPTAAFYNEKIVNDEKDLLAPVNLIVCGWEEEEQVELQIDIPDGTSTKTTLVAQESSYNTLDGDFYLINETQYIYFPPVNSPIGEYIFTFTGTSGVVKYIINYAMSKFPMAYMISLGTLESDAYSTNIVLPAMDDSPIVVLSGYQPRERVRLFLYDTGRFQAWKDYHVDAYGRLSIQAKDFGSIVVIGDKSSTEIHPLSYPIGFTVSLPGKLDPVYLTCKDTIPTRLKIGDYAVVSAFTSTSNRLRSEPTISAKLLGKLAPNTMMEIVDGPACADGILWWKVKGIDQDFDGWTGEGDTRYWLNPCYSKDYC